MSHAHNEVPTIAALTDLVSRCKEIDRYHTQLSAAEETRISAMASAIVSMKRVLELEQVERDTLPTRHLRAEHWSLMCPGTAAAMTPAVKAVRGLLVLDDHGQLKILSGRTWRGSWRNVTLWKDGVEGLSAPGLLEFLARLASVAQERAPDVAQSLLERRKALLWTQSLGPSGPRGAVVQGRAD
jgi:hypothetical protein